MGCFNHHLLTLARESRGLTQAELAFRALMAQGTLSKYETGMAEPPEPAAKDIANALGFPLRFFYQSEQVFGFPPFHYRKRKKLSAKTLGRIVAEMNIRRIHVRRMCVSYELKTNGFIPEIDRDEYHAGRKQRLNVEDVARAVREMWMVPPGPIPNMIELLESNGAVVIPCEFETDLLDAMSQRIDGMPVLFFVNAHAPADRLRHTLAHELGHMVLHTTDLKDDTAMEDEADAFAGAFLLPADEIRPQLRRFDLRQLANMKQYWKVSMASIAVRADRLKLITEHQKKMFWMEMSRLGYRKHEPHEPPKEQPASLRKMVDFHRTQLGYSFQEMADLLDLSVSEFAEMYGPAALRDPPERRGHLRVVK